MILSSRPPTHPAPALFKEYHWLLDVASLQIVGFKIQTGLNTATGPRLGLHSPSNDSLHYTIQVPMGDADRTLEKSDCTQPRVTT